jgi:hypothetical protein
MQKNRPFRFSFAQTCVAVFLFANVAAQAAPLLRCEVTYAGTTQVIETTPVEDAYEVKPFDIAGRFLFKVVMSAHKGKLKHVLIYAYLQQETRPILLQQAKYSAPFKPSSRPYLLTGEQHIYGGPIERELIYRCELQSAKP